MHLTWSFKPFTTLTTEEFHNIVRLRVDVFVVEQTCAYAELDGRDQQPGTLHVQALEESDLVAYARLLDVECTDNTTPVRVGRVVTRASHRGKGIARLLMQRVLNELDKRCSDRPVMLAAQVDVEKFYQSLGFIACSDVYDEDGIAHIDMQLERK